MKVLLVAVALSLLVFSSLWSQVHGTTIAIFCDDDSIVVVTDSKLSRTDGSGLSNGFCKIRRIGACWWTVGGFYGSQDLGYDVWSIIDSVALTSHGLRDMADGFVRVDSIPLTNALRREWTMNQDVFYSMDRTNVLQAVFFFGIDQGRPRCYLRAFIRDTKRKFVTPRYLGEAWANDIKMQLIPYDLAKEFIDRHPKLRGADHLGIATRFVKYAIKNRPDQCGFPLDTIIIRKNGTISDHRRSTCRSSEY